MPAWVEKKIKKRGGVIRWRTMKKHGKTLRVAVTRKIGKRGGKTVAYEIHPKKTATRRTTVKARTHRKNK